jgi:hypothetical protein
MGRQAPGMFVRGLDVPNASNDLVSQEHYEMFSTSYVVISSMQFLPHYGFLYNAAVEGQPLNTKELLNQVIAKLLRPRLDTVPLDFAVVTVLLAKSANQFGETLRRCHGIQTVPNP